MNHVQGIKTKAHTPFATAPLPASARETKAREAQIKAILHALFANKLQEAESVAEGPATKSSPSSSRFPESPAKIAQIASKKLMSSPLEDEEKELNDIEFDYTATGDDWLTEEYLKRICPRGRYRDPRSADTICFAILNKTCTDRNEWDLSKIFPARTISAADVQQLTIQQIKALNVPTFFSIIDLYSGEQTIKFLGLDCMTESVIMALCFFNKAFGTAFAAAQKGWYNAPIDEATQKAAKLAFASYKKYSPEEMQEFMSNPRFKKIEQGQMLCSYSLTEKSLDKTLSIMRWRNLNVKFLPIGLQKPVTLDFLIQLNTAFREPKNSEFGFRKTRSEVVHNDEVAYFVPGSAVESEMKQFAATLNSQLEQCDAGKENPIVVAAYSYQKLISIHPFLDANGRTARFVADLILRRYGLLPVTWQEKHRNVSVQLHVPEKVTSTTSLKWLLEDLERSYKLSESDKKLEASAPSPPAHEAASSSQSSSASSSSPISGTPQNKPKKNKRKKK